MGPAYVFGTRSIQMINTTVQRIRRFISRSPIMMVQPPWVSVIRDPVSHHAVECSRAQRQRIPIGMHHTGVRTGPIAGFSCVAIRGQVLICKGVTELRIKPARSR